MNMFLIFFVVFFLFGKEKNNYYNTSEDSLVNIVDKKTNIAIHFMKYYICIYKSTFTNLNLNNKNNLNNKLIPIYIGKFLNIFDELYNNSYKEKMSYLITLKTKSNIDISFFNDKEIIEEEDLIDYTSFLLREVVFEKKNPSAISTLLFSNGHDMIKMTADTYTEKNRTFYRIHANSLRIIFKRDIESLLHIMKKYKIGNTIQKRDLYELKSQAVNIFNNSQENIEYYCIYYYKDHLYGECAKKKDFDEKECVLFIIGIINQEIIYLYLIDKCCSNVERKI
ncbi:hypothetical protein AB836_01130 [Rickettsiales bacterium (ex Bugula neritina AB1)]|nr:hypothetical protein AB836_01130 [Rickettsiales bacterium (ex Bugula neritina AB1)]